MDLVIDANILFAALIKKNVTSDLIVHKNLHLFTPEFIFTEFEKYKDTIKKKTERTDEEWDEFLATLERNITIIPYVEIKPFLKKAKEISPDPKDVPYIALALKLNIAIWSQDKALQEKQTAIQIYNTTNLLITLK